MSSIVYVYKGKDGAFLGRNGYGKSSGVVAFNLHAGTIIALVPLTSRGVSARASIDIPAADANAIADVVAPAKGKALRDLQKVTQELLDDGVLENHPKFKVFRAAVRRATKEVLK